MEEVLHPMLGAFWIIYLARSALNAGQRRDQEAERILLIDAQFDFDLMIEKT